MTFSTAALSAIKPLSASGNSSTFWGGLVMACVSFHQFIIPLCFNQMEMAVFFGSDDHWCLGRIVIECPRIRQRPVLPQKVPDRALKPPAHDRLRNVVAAAQNSSSYARQRQLCARHPKIKNVHLIPALLQPTHDLYVPLPRKRCLKPKILPPARVKLNLLEHQPPSSKSRALR